MSSGQFPGWPDDPVKTPEVSGDPSAQINPNALGPAPRISARSMQVSLPKVAPVEGHDEELRRPPPSRSNPLGGVLGGLLGAIVGGAVFGAISAAITSYFSLIPLVLVGAGAGWCAGMGVRLLGKAASPVYGVVGACFALLAAAWGHLFDLAFNLTLAGNAGSFGMVFSEPLKYLDGGTGVLGYFGYPVAAAVGFFSSFRRAAR